MYRRDRINERDVPESQHTIFIRGLPGTMTTEEIRDFFGPDAGCSFDFVKVSPDRTKLYVAIRFDSKTTAREIMEKYGNNDGQILGYDVELSWFRDIRRYLAHCAKQGIPPSRFNNNDRRDFRGDRGGGFRGGRRGRSRSISPLRTRSRSHPTTRSHSRSRSVSISPARDGSNARAPRTYSRSASPRSRSHSKGARSRSRSGSASSARSSPKPQDYNEAVKVEQQPLHSPSPPPRKSKKKKERKERKKRRHQSPSQSPAHSDGGSSDGGRSEGEIQSPKGNGNRAKQQQAPSMTMTSSKPIGPNKPDVMLQQQRAYEAPYGFRHIPEGSLMASQQQQQATANSQAAAAVNQASQQQPDTTSSGGYGLLQRQQQQQQPNKFRQTFTVDLDPNAPTLPKFKPIADSSQSINNNLYQSVNGGSKVNNEEIVKRPRLESPPPPMPVANIRNATAALSPVRESGPLAGNVFKDIQRQILQDVRYKAQPEPEEESLGGLRLSLLSKQRMTDDMREEKVAKLSSELRERVTKKKRQLELSYRHDCETFGLVTRKLIEKDRNLEDRLKLALLETMKDLEGETLKQLDEFLDQLSYIYQ